MTTSVRRTAFALGFAGLLPQMAATVLALGRDAVAPVVALAYGLLILSFLGGMWWGFAMRRADDPAQGRLALVAVVPSLAALAIAIATFHTGRLDWGLVATGVALFLTLPVDRSLTRDGDAPADWMRLRVPLSVGLGALTILTGWIVAPA
jgi:peptidoglycan/LPS O-acetylase OafA/YrhL